MFIPQQKKVWSHPRHQDPFGWMSKRDEHCWEAGNLRSETMLWYSFSRLSLTPNYWRTRYFFGNSKKARIIRNVEAKKKNRISQGGRQASLWMCVYPNISTILPQKWLKTWDTHPIDPPLTPHWGPIMISWSPLSHHSCSFLKGKNIPMDQFHNVPHTTRINR